MMLFQENPQEVPEELVIEEKTISIIDLILNGGVATDRRSDQQNRSPPPHQNRQTNRVKL